MKEPKGKNLIKTIKKPRNSIRKDGLAGLTASIAPRKNCERGVKKHEKKSIRTKQKSRFRTIPKFTIKTVKITLFLNHPKWVKHPVRGLDDGTSKNGVAQGLGTRT